MSEQVGGAATSAPILQQKLLQEKQKIHKSKYVLTKEATCYSFCGQWILQLVTLLEAYSGFLVHVPLSGMYVGAIRYLCTCSNY